MSKLVVALLAFILAGCVPTMFRSDREVAEDIAAPAGLAERERSAGAFVLATRERFSVSGSEVMLYVSEQEAKTTGAEAPVVFGAGTLTG